MQNENGFDRLARVILGAIVLLLVFVGPKTPLGWLGLIPLITGLIGFCPLYRLLGINTCRKRR
jgi:xanthine/uracil permease